MFMSCAMQRLSGKTNQRGASVDKNLSDDRSLLEKIPTRLMNYGSRGWGGLAGAAAVSAKADGQMSHEISHPLHKRDDLET